jgi:flavin reductase (DIM6/NTAB) family NADH-FMN oxidoreductase RutF
MMNGQGDIMSLNADTLRRTMRQWATGVTIVTARSGDQRHGMTVSSFTSVSLDPPLVLISLADNARTAELIRKARAFGVTILSEDQQEISNAFAGRVPDSEDRFAGVETEALRGGAPFIKGGLAYLDCRLVAEYPAGTSNLFVGEVIDAQANEGPKPLLYFNRDYKDLCP